MKQIDRRGFLSVTGRAGLGLTGGAMLLNALDARAPSRKRANIILILVDDLGWSDVGCYGNTFNETPNIDRLADHGMRFTDAYAAAPVCSPTRASIMTGQYPARVGITDYLRADDRKFLSPDHLTITKALRLGGYVSGLIGKWHLMGDYGKRKGDPKLHGFDEVICSEERYIGAGDYFHPYDHLPGVEARTANEYLTDRLSLEAADFITRHKDRPFFLFLSYYAVHTRLAGKKGTVERYSRKAGADERVNKPKLAAMLESIDQGVGMVMARLRELGVADDTVVIFTSDNGGEDRVTSNAPLRGGKSQLYEGGIRVPLIIRSPDVAQPGSTCRVPVSTVDLYPTMMELAGVNAPPQEPIDGQSMAPLLSGGTRLERDAIFWHYPLDAPHFLGGRSCGTVRRGDLKLIEFYDTGEVEMYDLNDDVGETSNLAAGMPGKASELQKLLADWRQSVGATPTAGP